MASPVRFPKGLSTFPPRSVLGSYPIATSPNQIDITDDFIPYLATNYTVTTAVAGAAATFPWLSGALKLTTSASATDTIYLQRGGAAFQALQGNQFWMDFKVAYPRSVANANDTNIYLGWFDNAVPSAASNGIYFIKPSGGTAVHFVIKKAGTTTTFQNIADLAVASGLFNDTQASVGVLSAIVAGNAFTGISVTTPGAGYQVTPLILTTTASGVAGNVPVMAQLGSTAINQGNPQTPVQTTGLAYGSLAAPYVTNPGSGYTNSAGTTTYLEVEPLIDLQVYFDGKGRLTVGVNGRAVLSIDGTATELGVTGFAPGATVNVATAAGGPSFYCTTQLTTAVAPFQPPIGSPFNCLPLVPMNIAFGMANTTANIRTFYVMEYNCAVELNEVGSLVSRVTRDGQKNAALQVHGWGERDADWSLLLDTVELKQPFKTVNLDAVYYALSDGVEVQLAWHGEERQPFLSLAGRGRIDYSELGGLVNTTDKPQTGHLEFRVLRAKPDALYSFVLDLSKH